MESYLSRDCVDKFGQGPKSHNNGDNMVTDATYARVKPGGAHD